MEIVRIGIIGMGGMGYTHCKNIVSIKETKLTCVCDNEESVAREKGKEFGVEYFCDYREMIKSGLCDAVMVVIPHWFHADASVFALENGLHVLCEKPLAVTVSDADRMVKAAKENGKIFTVMHQVRTEPLFRKAKEMITSGVIGEVRRTLCIDTWYRAQSYYDSNSWRATWKGEGGGVLINQAPHIIDLFIMLGGFPVRIKANTRTRLHEIEVEDEAAAVLEYENGAWGYYYVTTCEPQDRHFRMEIAGDRGKLAIRGYNLYLYKYSAPISKYTYEAKEMWGGITLESESRKFKSNVATGAVEIIKNFAAAILRGEELFVSGEDSLRTMEFINACILSGKKNKPVDLPVDRKEYDRLINALKKSSKPKKRVIVQRATDPRLLKK
jgi:predicted dehydrogenase